MTRKEAIAFAISTRKPITHRYFSDDEFVYYDDKGNLRDESGYFLPNDEFWGMRTGDYWETDWREYEKN